MAVVYVPVRGADSATPPPQAAAKPSTGGNSIPTKDARVPPGYRIGPGDVLQIAVWKEPDASVASVVVRADGKISVPLVKEVAVAGMTPAEAETMLAAKLSQFIHGADVTVVPKEIHSQKVYLLGGVKKEGPLILEAPTTVLQAITEAGGLTEEAKPKKIYVLRKENGQQVRFPFNYNAVIKGERMEQNIILRPEDLVVVPH
jgi:polysaccharide export outer membrane protein